MANGKCSALDEFRAAETDIGVSVEEKIVSFDGREKAGGVSSDTGTELAESAGDTRSTKVTKNSAVVLEGQEIKIAPVIDPCRPQPLLQNKLQINLSLFHHLGLLCFLNLQTISASIVKEKMVSRSATPRCKQKKVRIMTRDSKSQKVK
jgi:hypothetical protein